MYTVCCYCDITRSSLLSSSSCSLPSHSFSQSHRLLPFLRHHDAVCVALASSLSSFVAHLSLSRPSTCLLPSLLTETYAPRFRSCLFVVCTTYYYHHPPTTRSSAVNNNLEEAAAASVTSRGGRLESGGEGGRGKRAAAFGKRRRPRPPAASPTNGATAGRIPL